MFNSIRLALVRAVGLVLAVLVLGTSGVTAQTGTITGRVIDAGNGEAVAAAQVFIADLDLGVLTQANGGYNLQEVPVGTHTVTIQRLGFQDETATVQVQDGATVTQNFTLSAAALQLDEVIVTGTAGGSQRRALGNVVDRMDEASLANRPSIRVEEALGSGIAGVRMQSPAGTAGGTAEIRIRGSSSLALSGEPLIYVDGIRLNTDRVFANRGSSTSRLQDIDPASIESIEIIKGPAAATLYGTEASNGVIQIITKKGVEGETTFDLSVEGGANWQPHPSRNFGLHWFEEPDTGEITNHNLYELLKQPEHLGRDLFQYGPIQRYSLSARGGSSLFRYYAGISRDDVEGFSGFDYTESWNAQASITAVPVEDLSVTLSMSRVSGSTRDIGTLMCSMDCWANPTRDREVVNGAADFYRGQSIGETDIRFRSRTSWSAQAAHTPTEWFSHRITGGVDNSGLTREFFVPRGGRGFGDRLGTNGEIGARSVWYVDIVNRTVDYSASVTLPITDQLTSVTSAGLQYFQEARGELFLDGEEFSVASLETIAGANARDASEAFIENITVGTFLQNEFNWNNRRFLTVAARFDDNSAFGTEFEAAVYPKVSGSWVMSEEEFWSSPLGLSELRLRGAWGESGKQPDAFAASRLWAPITGPGEPALTPLAIGNPDLGPEIGSEIELGFDAAFLDDRVGLGFTWYNRTTKDAIVANPIRPSVGFPGSQLVNIGEVSAWGTETSLNAQVMREDPLRWDVSLALGTMGSQINDMGGLGQLIVTSLEDGMDSRSQFHTTDFPVASLFEKRVVSAEFVEGNSGPVTNIMCDGGTGKRGLEFGGDAVPCSEAPRLFFGQVDPSWTISLNNAFTFRENWRLAVTVDAMGGHHLNADYIAGQNTRHSEKHVREDDLFYQANQTIARGANVIHAAGFAKLREVSLRYTIPTGLAQRVGASSASVVGQLFNIANLWIEEEFTPDGSRIWDPEMISPNMEYSGYVSGPPPPMSRATVRVNVTF